MVNGDLVLSDVYERGFLRMAGTVAVIWQFAVLAQVLLYLHDYREPAVPVAVWLGLLAAAAWLVPPSRAGGLTRPQALGAAGIAVAAVLIVGWERRASGVTGSVDWSVIGTGWLLALVAVSRPAWEWITATLLVFAAHTAVFIQVLGLATLSLSRLAATAYTLIVVLVVFAALRATLRGQAVVAARRAELASRSAAERAAADAVAADRATRLGLLEQEVLPLLRAIADGRADPADARVRAECGARAAALRRALVDRAGGGNALLTALQPALRAAAERGLEAEVQVVGDPAPSAPQAISAATGAVARLLSVLPPQQVMLTMLADQDATELYLVFRQPPTEAPAEDGRAAALAPVPGWRAAVEMDADGGCLEVRWAGLATA